MIALRRRAVNPVAPVLAPILVILLVACGSTATASRSPEPSPSGRSISTPGPGGPASPSVVASIRLPTTTSTAFGKIFDALPPSFPKLPGEEPAGTGAGPTSGSFAASLSVSDARKTIEAALIAQGWNVVVGSPLEDGTVVLEATRAKPACRTEVRFTPTSGTVTMAVLYGASCPFG
ncbi:MAG TPA: hypothetical protein VGJ17_04685 [Candidatus Limnocylindrales bacterium]